jgi:enamine deaminase RidA (YjgF/YER057c/UK114 family)
MAAQNETHKSMLVRRSGRSLYAVDVRRDGMTEQLLTFRPVRQVDRMESLASFFGRIADYLAACGVDIIQERCYGRSDAFTEILTQRTAAYRQYMIADEGAFFFVGQAPCDESAVAGVQIWAAGPRGKGLVAPLHVDGAPVGTRFFDGHTSFTSIQNIGPASRNGHARQDQAVEMFERAAELLGTQGLSYHNVVRTWIYIPELLEWYGELNVARRAVFKKAGLLDGEKPPAWLPASTGIQGRCPAGRSCMMGVLAVSHANGTRVGTVESPRQCEAFAYGSAFSRAVELRDKSLSRMYVSGTASIDNSGATVHVGDIEKQTAQTLCAIRELLGARDHGMHDVVHATVFLKRPEFLPAYRRVAAEEGLDWACTVETIADVCRDDLLVEIEALSVKAF